MVINMMWPWSSEMWLWILALPGTGYVALGKSLTSWSLLFLLYKMVVSQGSPSHKAVVTINKMRPGKCLVPCWRPDKWRPLRSFPHVMSSGLLICFWPGITSKGDWGREGQKGQETCDGQIEYDLRCLHMADGRREWLALCLASSTCVQAMSMRWC